MKKSLASDIVRFGLAVVVALGFTSSAFAAGQKDARVTQIVRDVKLLASKSGARPATVNDSVGEGQAVRTGGDSRAELTFTNQSITRLGANTVFSYGQGAKQLDLSSGAALIIVPKAAGEVRINTAAATAAVTGFTALVESHKTAANKIMIIDGHACAKKLINGAATGACIDLYAGDMLVLQPGTRGNGAVQKFDIQKAIKTARLLNGFNNKLPGWAQNELQGGINLQNGGGVNNNPGTGGKDPTGVGTVDQKTTAQEQQSQPPKIVPPPGPPPH